MLARPRDGQETRWLVDAIARDLWRLYGGAEGLNWDAANRHLASLAREARLEARRAREALRASIAGVPSPTSTGGVSGAGTPRDRLAT
jgi:hypothetical protein